MFHERTPANEALLREVRRIVRAAAPEAEEYFAAFEVLMMAP